MRVILRSAVVMSSYACFGKFWQDPSVCVYPVCFSSLQIFFQKLFLPSMARGQFLLPDFAAECFLIGGEQLILSYKINFFSIIFVFFELLLGICVAFFFSQCSSSLGENLCFLFIVSTRLVHSKFIFQLSLFQMADFQLRLAESCSLSGSSFPFYLIFKRFFCMCFIVDISILVSILFLNASLLTFSNLFSYKYSLLS